ncbi:hypothetical protein L596_027726 [Steinernema carpocapsae]|uniref:Uncharacterized protein n=1 Tax=Steinernema carpocapsae TaxID=34508 RepID=A0A4U5LWC6_STECR|nr:hypothetical protein L596_027726 [Steinernema carpocapsae]
MQIPESSHGKDARKTMRQMLFETSAKGFHATRASVKFNSLRATPLEAEKRHVCPATELSPSNAYSMTAERRWHIISLVYHQPDRRGNPRKTYVTSDPAASVGDHYTAGTNCRRRSITPAPGREHLVLQPLLAHCAYGPGR